MCADKQPKEQVTKGIAFDVIHFAWGRRHACEDIGRRHTSKFVHVSLETEAFKSKAPETS